MIYPLVPFPMTLSDPWLIQGHGVTIYALDVLFAQLTRNLFAIAKLLLKVLLQKGMRSFPGQSLASTDDSRTRRFPDKTFPGQTIPGQYVFQAPFLPRDALHKRGLCRPIVTIRLYSSTSLKSISLKWWLYHQNVQTDFTIQFKFVEMASSIILHFDGSIASQLLMPLILPSFKYVDIHRHSSSVNQ